jgi:hypothetical protein
MCSTRPKIVIEVSHSLHNMVNGPYYAMNAVIMTRLIFALSMGNGKHEWSYTLVVWGFANMTRRSGYMVYSNTT